MEVKIKACVGSIESNRAGDRSEKARVRADYESSRIMGSITFDIPIANTSEYFVGQVISITISTQ